jgi:hypothetical protein
MRLTEQILMQGRSYRGGWSRRQTDLFGVPWPLKHGWKDRII